MARINLVRNTGNSMNKTNMVFCKRLKREMPALKEAPIKGPIGELILENVSEEAWLEWVEAQIKIINEERLDLSDEAGQERLYQEMIAFLGLGDLVD